MVQTHIRRKRLAPSQNPWLSEIKQMSNKELIQMLAEERELKRRGLYTNPAYYEALRLEAFDRVLETVR